MRLCAPTFRVNSVVQKPIVAFMPVFDRSQHRLPWNVPQQLTANVLHYLSMKEQLYLVDLEKTGQLSKEMTPSDDPFGPDLHWLKKKFRSEEFVAFVELSKHEETLLNFHKTFPDADCPAELYLSARIRVFDLRGAKPKLVLSEVINHSENIPKEFNRINKRPEQENFQTTPQGMAHNTFAKEIAQRIEDYVLRAQMNSLQEVN